VQASWFSSFAEEEEEEEDEDEGEDEEGERRGKGKGREGRRGGWMWGRRRVGPRTGSTRG